MTQKIVQVRPIRWFLDYFKNLKFRWKLFWSYILAVILPVTILGIYSYSLAGSALLAETKAWMGESAMQTAENINARFARYNSVMEYVVFNGQILRVVNDVTSTSYQKYVDYTQTIDPVFITTLSLNAEVSSLLIYTDNPTIEERANTFAPIDRIRVEEWFSSIRDSGKPYWYTEGGTMRGYLRFHKRFRDSPDNVLEARLNLEKVFNLDNNPVSEHGIAIYDGQGRLVYAHDNLPAEIVAQKPADFLERLSGPQTDEVRIGGVRFLVIEQRIAETGWTMYYYSPLIARPGGAGGILGATLIIIASCLVILVLLTWIFSNTLVRRIHNLNRKMQQVEDGNMELVVTSSTRDEIGELTNRFGKMLRRINVLIDEIYKSRIVQKEAEMKALQAQINPHYLYNTLSLINWKAIQIDAMEISQITRNISRYYRTVLNSGKDIISIEDELANTRCYLDIQLVMHDQSFDVHYDIDPAILPYRMIKIILQPIVENAIEHGIDRLTGRRGVIRVHGSLHEDHILLSVSDNGPGMTPEIAETILGIESSGYGLKNVNERLKLFFGAEYGLSVDSIPGAGTTIAVRIPLWTAHEQQGT